MLKIEIVKVDSPQVVDVICNACGESCRDNLGMNFEYADVSAAWGYGSKKDMEVHRGHLCEACYDKLVASWKIPPDSDG